MTATYEMLFLLKNSHVFFNEELDLYIFPQTIQVYHENEVATKDHKFLES